MGSKMSQTKQSWIKEDLGHQAKGLPWWEIRNHLGVSLTKVLKAPAMVYNIDCTCGDMWSPKICKKICKKE